MSENPQAAHGTITYIGSACFVLASLGIFFSGFTLMILAAIARGGCNVVSVTNKTPGTLVFDHPYASTAYGIDDGTDLHTYRISPVLTPNFNHVGPDEIITFQLDQNLARYALAVVYNSTEKPDLTDYPLEFLLTKCSAFGYRSEVRAYGQDALGCTYYAQPTFSPPIFGTPLCHFNFFNNCPPVFTEEKNLRGYRADRKPAKKINNFT